jgi:N-acetylmuramoyl-L-alanine amidase
MKKFVFLFMIFLILLTESIGNANIEHINFVPIRKNIVKYSTASVQKDTSKDEIKCLALNIYFEAANQSTAGKLAVAIVTHNRVKSNTFCEVVYDSKKDFQNNPIKNNCQFSWYCDGKTDIPYEGKQWKISKELASWFYRNRTKIPDITDGSTHYHGDYIKRPYWSKIFSKTVSIDNHIFYKD